MERERNKQASLLMLTLLAGLLSQNLLIPVMAITSVAEQKNYYSPTPHGGSPPKSSGGGNPSHGSGGGTPSYGGGSPSSGGTPSHGGGTPSPSCGNPPSGGHSRPTPSPPTGGSYTPPSGGGTPTTPVGGTPPVTVTPTTPVGGTPPVTVTPTTPVGGTPPVTVPSPPYGFDPNSPPFTCNYWRTHPGLIWGVLGWWGTVCGVFGVASVPGYGTSMTLPQALSNARTDGYGALYREGTASLLNSMVDKRFPFSTTQVRDNFVAGISSNKAAADQAHRFKLANEGRLKPRS